MHFNPSNCLMIFATALSPLALSPSSVAGPPTTGIAANEFAPAPAPVVGAGSSGSSSLATSLELLALTMVAALSLTLF